MKLDGHSTQYVIQIEHPVVKDEWWESSQWSSEYDKDNLEQAMLVYESLKILYIGRNLRMLEIVTQAFVREETQC